MFENTRPDDSGTCEIKDKHSHDTLVREVRGKLPPDENLFRLADLFKVFAIRPEFESSMLFLKQSFASAQSPSLSE